MKPQGQRPVQQRTSAPRSRQRTMPLLASWQHQHRADPRSSYLVRLPRSTHGLLCAIPRHDAVRRSQDSVVCCHQPRSRPARPQVSVAHASTDRRTADCCRWNPRCQPLMSLITLICAGELISCLSLQSSSLPSSRKMKKYKNNCGHGQRKLSRN